VLDLAGDEATLPLPDTAGAEWPDAAPSQVAANSWMAARFGARPAGTAANDDPQLELAIALAAVEEGPLARSILDGLVAAYGDQPYELLDLARASAEAGLHDVALNASARLLSGLGAFERLDAPLAIEALLYPTAYEDEVLAAAEAEGVPPLLLLALVRQESAFDPDAGSTAGAMGLTQVIEPTGAAIAESLGVDWDLSLLFEPETSLRFGAHYLAEQLERFDGNVVAALAAYNAGPGSAQRWLDEQRYPGADGYLHTVDFTETRAYLQRVLENYAWYRYLYTDAPLPAIR
jgi:soluble lytic murein transglycosylase